MVVNGPVRAVTFKYEIHARVTFAVGFQNDQSLARDRHDPVLAALTTLDVDHPPMEVYVGPLKVTCFKCAEAAIVDYGKKCLGIQLTATEQIPHLFCRHHPWKFFLPADRRKGKAGEFIITQSAEVTLQSINEVLELGFGR